MKTGFLISLFLFGLLLYLLLKTNKRVQAIQAELQNDPTTVLDSATIDYAAYYQALTK